MRGQEVQPNSLPPVVSSSEDASGEQASADASPASGNASEVDAGHLMDLQAEVRESVSATQSQLSEGSQPAGTPPPAELPLVKGESGPADPTTPQTHLVQSADGQPAADGEPVEALRSADSNSQVLEHAPESTVRDGVAKINEGSDAQLQHGAGARLRRRRLQEVEQQCSSVTARSPEADPRWACCGWLQATISMARVVRRRCSSTTPAGQR